jgi:hypothetical protein
MEFGDLSPTERENNESRYYPGIAWFTVMAMVLPPEEAPPPPRQGPRGDPAERPPLQLPPVVVSGFTGRQWRLGHGARAARVPRTWLPISPTARLAWARLRLWLGRLQCHVGRHWLLRLMALQLCFSLFGGVPRQTLSALRAVLRVFWPRQWPTPAAVWYQLNREPC